MKPEEYCLLPEEVWSKLFHTYSLALNQHPLQRRVIKAGYFVRHLEIEIHLLRLQFCCISKLNDVIESEFSRDDTLDNVVMKMCSMFHIATEEDVRLWTKCTVDEYLPVQNRNETLQNLCLSRPVFSDRTMELRVTLDEAEEWEAVGNDNVQFVVFSQLDSVEFLQYLLDRFAMDSEAGPGLSS